ncbi:hypothetical protein Pmani_034918 [Petrolisthes manimaculis]|uniref:Pro-resilin n=1 Tax=Petrolisthes manimaculis TaxID=1843537 RepID=A0AAE1NLM5_9EUCA|nr:hypothetical protein Pmani_034918 [Petrolisthes manimaculis]
MIQTHPLIPLNMNCKLTLGLLLLTGAVFVSAELQPIYGYDDGRQGGGRRRFDDDFSDDYDSDSGSYSFEWDVSDESSENYYGHYESKNGDLTEGGYHVLLPDGRLMTVKYYVDGDSGFVHDISFEGSAEFDSGYSRSREFDSGFSRSREFGSGYRGINSGYLGSRGFNSGSRGFGAQRFGSSDSRSRESGSFGSRSRESRSFESRSDESRDSFGSRYDSRGF